MQSLYPLQERNNGKSEERSDVEADVPLLRVSFEFKNEEFLEHCHKRSNAETTFHMIKSKFGDAVRSKTEVAQINEALLKVLCHNICVVIQEMFELGIEPNFFTS